MKRTAPLLLLVLAATATPVAAQSDETAGQHRRIKVVFSDDGVTREHVWVEPEEGETEIFIAGDPSGEAYALRPILHSRAYLGVQLLDITPELRQHFGAPAEAGVLVSAVEDGSPAASAGLAVGDVLTKIDGEAVSRTGQVIRKIATREKNTGVELELVRDHRTLSLAATLGERPRSQVDLAPMFWAPGDGGRRILRLPDSVIEIERGDLEEAFSELHEHLDSPEWRRQLEEMTSRRRGLEDRIRELEERLREMEKRLEEEPN